jgi:hypothetical protein
MDKNRGKRGEMKHVEQELPVILALGFLAEEGETVTAEILALRAAAYIERVRELMAKFEEYSRADDMRCRRQCFKFVVKKLQAVLEGKP